MIGPVRYWREIPQRYRYEAARCSGCGKVFFPPRLVCNACRGREFKPVILPQAGTLETFTIIRVASRTRRPTRSGSCGSGTR
jgi:uncharacterized OB-fold protein